METLVSIISEKYLRIVIAWELIMAIKLNCLSYKLKIISFFKDFFLHLFCHFAVQDNQGTS